MLVTSALAADTISRPRRPPHASLGLDPIFDNADANKSSAETEFAGRNRLSPPAKWVYVLKSVDAAGLQACGAELAVIDYSEDGSKAKEFTREKVDAMRTKSAGQRMKLIAYMSIGEAESYRDLYFRPEWKRSPPSWLKGENPAWPGNFKVEYWNKEWKRIIYGGPGSYLDKIIAAGFDGVYLDIVDAFEAFQDKRRSAAQDMVDFVAEISQYATRLNRDFLVIPQNGEALLANPVYRGHISAIGIESLYWRAVPVPGDEPEEHRDDVERNFASNRDERLGRYLDLAIADRIPVLTVEYLLDQPEDAVEVPATAKEMRARGLIPHFSVRQLDRLHCE